MKKSELIKLLSVVDDNADVTIRVYDHSNFIGYGDIEGVSDIVSGDEYTNEISIDCEVV